MEENRRVKREKTIKVQSPLGTLNNSKENIKKASDNKFLKLELLPVDANGFEVSARAKILKHLRDGETFYFGRSKSLGITDTRISRNQLMIVAVITRDQPTLSIKNSGMNFSRYARKQSRDKTRMISKDEPVHLKNGDEIELFANIERFRISIEVINELPAQTLNNSMEKEKEKRSRSASSSGSLKNSSNNIKSDNINNSHNDNNVNNNTTDNSVVSAVSPRTRNSALISPKRLPDSEKKISKRDQSHRHSLHEHRSASPKVKPSKAHDEKKRPISEEKVRQIQEILPGVPRYKVVSALKAYSGDIERATNYILTRPNEVPDQPMEDVSPQRDDVPLSPLASPQHSDDAHVIVVDDEDEELKKERDEMEIELYFSADGSKEKNDSDDEGSVHEENDILLPSDPSQVEKIDLDVDDEKVLAGKYDHFLKSHSLPDELFVHSPTSNAPVDMAAQNISELFTQLQAANAKVGELEKQVKILTGGFGFEVFMKMKKAHAEASKKKEKSECMICYEKKKKITTACGCKVMCKSCYNKLPKKSCPNCNKPILYYNASS